MPAKGQVPGNWAGAVGWHASGGAVAAITLFLLLGGCQCLSVSAAAESAEAAGRFSENYVEIAEVVCRFRRSRPGIPIYHRPAFRSEAGHLEGVNLGRRGCCRVVVVRVKRVVKMSPA